MSRAPHRLLFLVTLVLLLGASPALGVGRFGDDDTSVHEGAIEALAAAGITKGCNPPTNNHYCPDRPVTRGQMATFLTRALDLPPSDHDPFSDDNSSVHQRAIQSLAAAGITKGCNPPTNNHYCPDRPVTRGQMATFLTRALGLEVPDGPGGAEDEGDPGFQRPSMEEPTVPAGAITVHPDQDLQALVESHPEGTAFLLQAGVYHISVEAKNRNQFFGQGAVLDGSHSLPNAFRGAASDVVVHGFEIRNYATPQDEGAIQYSGGNNWIVWGNYVHHNSRIGIDAGPGWTVVENRTVSNGQYGIVASGDGVLIESNEITHNNTCGCDAGDDGGTKFLRTKHLIVRGNHVHHNDGNGIWTDINNIHTLIENNHVHDNTGIGILHEISYDAQIRGNLVERNGFGNSAGVDGAGIAVTNSPNVGVYDNTVVANSDGIVGIQHDRSGDPSEVGPEYGRRDLMNLYVHHNRIVMTSGEIGIVSYTADVWGWNNRFDFNTYELQHRPNAYVWNADVYLDPTGWQAFGNDVNGEWD